jgi:hypothetical protein
MLPGSVNTIYYPGDPILVADGISEMNVAVQRLHVAPTETVVEPPVFRRYLRACGWEEIAAKGNLLLFSRHTNHGVVEVEIPKKSSFVDYEHRIQEAMEILVLIEGRSATDISAALASVAGDAPGLFDGIEKD